MACTIYVRQKVLLNYQLIKKHFSQAVSPVYTYFVSLDSGLKYITL